MLNGTNGMQKAYRIVQESRPVLRRENLIHAEEGIVRLREVDRVVSPQIASKELNGLYGQSVLGRG